MELAKVFCMTKNEYDMIEHFILYYAKLFGYHNIVLIDNMSTHPTVLEVYKKYVPLGVTVVYHNSYENHEQGYGTSKYMHMFKNQCQFVIPVDTDEYLFSSLHYQDRLSPQDVIDALKAIPEDITMCQLSDYHFSVVNPNEPGYINQKYQNPILEMNTFDQRPNKIVKLFYRSSAFLCTMNGNHDGLASSGRREKVPLGFFHYNSTGSRRDYERHKMHVEGFRYLDTTLPLVEQLKPLFLEKERFGYGVHRVDAYRVVLVRAYVINLFVLHFQRLPTITELDKYAKEHLENPWAFGMTFFSSVSPNDDLSLKEITKEKFDALLFYDPPIEKEEYYFVYTKVSELIQNQ
jgi:hypothetical protein